MANYDSQPVMEVMLTNAMLDCEMKTLKSKIHSKNDENKKLEKMITEYKQKISQLEKAIQDAQEREEKVKTNIDSLRNSRHISEGLVMSMKNELRVKQEKRAQTKKEREKIIQKYSNIFQSYREVYKKLPWIQQNHELKLCIERGKIQLNVLKTEFASYMKKVSLFHKISEQRMQVAIINLAKILVNRNKLNEEVNNNSLKIMNAESHITKLKEVKSRKLEQIDMKVKAAVAEARERAAKIQAGNFGDANKQTAPTPVVSSISARSTIESIFSRLGIGGPLSLKRPNLFKPSLPEKVPRTAEITHPVDSFLKKDVKDAQLQNKAVANTQAKHHPLQSHSETSTKKGKVEKLEQKYKSNNGNKLPIFNSKRISESVDTIKRKLENVELIKRKVENTGTIKQKLENEGKSKQKLENEDKSKHKLENEDKSKQKLENEDESKQKLENDDKSKRKEESLAKTSPKSKVTPEKTQLSSLPIVAQPISKQVSPKKLTSSDSDEVPEKSEKRKKKLKKKMKKVVTEKSHGQEYVENKNETKLAAGNNKTLLIPEVEAMETEVIPENPPDPVPSTSAEMMQTSPEEQQLPSEIKASEQVAKVPKFPVNVYPQEMSATDSDAGSDCFREFIGKYKGGSAEQIISAADISLDSDSVLSGNFNMDHPEDIAGHNISSPELFIQARQGQGFSFSPPFGPEQTSSPVKPEKDKKKSGNEFGGSGGMSSFFQIDSSKTTTGAPSSSFTDFFGSMSPKKSDQSFFQLF